MVAAPGEFIGSVAKPGGFFRRTSGQRFVRRWSGRMNSLAPIFQRLLVGKKPLDRVICGFAFWRDRIGQITALSCQNSGRTIKLLWPTVRRLKATSVAAANPTKKQTLNATAPYAISSSGQRIVNSTTGQKRACGNLRRGLSAIEKLRSAKTGVLFSASTANG